MRVRTQNTGLGALPQTKCTGRAGCAALPALDLLCGKNHDISGAMSGHGQHDVGGDSHASHDDHHDETTSDDFPADEPRSPGWLPLLGGGLLLAAILGFVVFGSDDQAAEAGKEAAAPAAAAPSAARPAPRPNPLQPGVALPPGHARVPTPGQ